VSAEPGEILGPKHHFVAPGKATLSVFEQEDSNMIYIAGPTAPFPSIIRASPDCFREFLNIMSSSVENHTKDAMNLEVLYPRPAAMHSAFRRERLGALSRGSLP
jgi:hypothetical protein